MAILFKLNLHAKRNELNCIFAHNYNIPLIDLIYVLRMIDGLIGLSLERYLKMFGRINSLGGKHATNMHIKTIS